MYLKNEVINYVWQNSRFYGDKLKECELLFKEEKGFPALILLFNIVENILKSEMENYDDSFYEIVNKLYEKGTINIQENNFLSEGNLSIRKIRNLFAHTNHYSISLEFTDEPGIQYRIIENESCLKLYDEISSITFNLLLKVISKNLGLDFDINLEEAIENFLQ